MPAALWVSSYSSSKAWGLVIAGGQDKNSARQRDVFHTLDGSNFRMLAPLPVASEHQCLAIIDDETLFITAGTYPKGSGSTYMFTKSRLGRILLYTDFS
jgi:hypothetical protein